MIRRVRPRSSDARTQRFAPVVSLRAALDDEALLGSFLRGASWLPWHTLLIASMGESLNEDERLMMLAEMQRAALIRGENVDLSNLLRLEDVGRHAIAFMRQLAGEVRDEAQPALTLEEHEEHLATFAGVEPRSAREPAGTGRTAPRQRNATGRRSKLRRRASCDDEA